MSRLFTVGLAVPCDELRINSTSALVLFVIRLAQLDSGGTTLAIGTSDEVHDQTECQLACSRGQL